MLAGRKDRKERLEKQHSGAWSSASQDYIRLATELFAHSVSHAQASGGNCSPYALAGIPTLFSALRALLIESARGMYGKGRNPAILSDLASSANELRILEAHLPLEPSLLSNMKLLYEIRNEIVHPAHTPAGTSSGSPAYLGSIRTAGLLQSTGNETADYCWISQLQSHRLFRFAFENIEAVAATILTASHTDQEFLILHMQSYTRYKGMGIIPQDIPEAGSIEQ